MQHSSMNPLTTALVCCIVTAVCFGQATAVLQQARPQNAMQSTRTAPLGVNATIASNRSTTAANTSSTAIPKVARLNTTKAINQSAAAAQSNTSRASNRTVAAARISSVLGKNRTAAEAATPVQFANQSNRTSSAQEASAKAKNNKTFQQTRTGQTNPTAAAAGVLQLEPDTPKISLDAEPRAMWMASACPPFANTQKYRTTDYEDILNTTVSISPRRPNADVPVGQWIQGRATYYGADDRLEASRVACGEPAGQFGIIEQGSCGYTNADGSLPFPRDMYAAAADTNEDYPGSCGRCYQIRCKTGSPYNNGRPLRVSDLMYYRPYEITDNLGRPWPGNPVLQEDLFYTRCWDDNTVITVRVGDSCPCKYPIKATGEIRTQYWCCGGNNHFDLSFWAFEKLAHPSYGVMPIEYRPVDCDTREPLKPVPGYVSKVIYKDTIQPGWTFRPYLSKETQLNAKGRGIRKEQGVCASLSKDGALAFVCRSCSQPGYQPFASSESLKFWLRSTTESMDPFASSTPPGELPELKVFLMNDDKSTYCGAEVRLSDEYVQRSTGPWFRVMVPLSAFRCDAGSVGGLAAVDRFDLQNTNIRDANVCLDDIQLD